MLAVLGSKLLEQLFTLHTISREQSIEVFSGPLGDEIGNQLICESVCEFAEKGAHLFLSGGWPAIRLVAQGGNGLLFGAELSLVAHQTFLVDVAEAKVQKFETSIFSMLNPFPDQQVVRPVG